MRPLVEIQRLLDELETIVADDLEGQDLDFKQWITDSVKDALAQVVEMAVCMANGGGGTVVFGVADKVKGRARALLGVPLEVDVHRLMKGVYDSTDPKITPYFEELPVPEGTGRLLVMQVQGGLAPYTDTQGRAKVRIGKDCQPLTGSLRSQVWVETGESDFTAVMVEEPWAETLSAAALETLRDTARREQAPQDLLQLSDLDLLQALEVVREGRLTRAALFLAGREAAIRRHFPHYVWTHARMRSATDYDDRQDGYDALGLALGQLMQRIMADNPLQTLTVGLFHHEYRTYPEIALRETLLNALCHQDFRLPGPVLVAQYPDRLEISNGGGFIGGISPANILHHRPAPRNPVLVNALVRLRLVNRLNLGVRRIFEAFLIEGKEPPRWIDQGEAVRVTLRRQDISAPFRWFVAEESQAGRVLTVDHLLVVRYLLEHPEIDTATAARQCQRLEEEAREVLNEMETRLGYLERGGGLGRGAFWTLRPELHNRLAGKGHAERDQRIDWETAKTRVLSVLRRRRQRGKPGLSNAEVRRIARLDRHQVLRLLHELQEEAPELRMLNRGRYARWFLEPANPES